MILGIQIKAARSLLKMSQVELQKKTGVSIATLQNIENYEEKIKTTAFRTIKKIKDTLEDEGIEFIPPTNDEDTDGCGVVLNKKK
jgi:transcriptional regulator with XRE-family HTH domain